MEESVPSSFREPFYQEVEEKHIHWESLFLQKEEHYYAYLYSVTCTPCSMLREDVIAFAERETVPFYFIDPNDDVPFTHSTTLADASLGATSLENVYCYSTPTLIGIEGGTITSYSRDYYQIRSFIEGE